VHARRQQRLRDVVGLAASNSARARGSLPRVTKTTALTSKGFDRASYGEARATALTLLQRGARRTFSKIEPAVALKLDKKMFTPRG
jgi:hypothetical protein